MHTVLYWLPLIGFGMFSWGVLVQIVKTVRRMSVQDIAVGEVVFRTLASVVMTAGVIPTKNFPLVVGSAINLAVLLAYLALVVAIRSTFDRDRVRAQQPPNRFNRSAK